MSAGPTDYPPAVLEEAEDASRHAFEKAQQVTALDPERRRSYATAQAANAYAAVLARYTVSQRLLRAEQDAEDERNRAIRAAQKGEHDTEPPPVDEDAQAEARAYERGRAEERANAVALLEQEAAKFDRESRAADVDARTFSRLSAKMSVLRTMAAYVARGDRADADRLAAKQGAASS